MSAADGTGLRVYRPDENSQRGQRRVCCVGLGYIGLPTSAVLAAAGHSVVGVDVKPEVVEGINRGEVHIVEPGLPELVGQMVATGRLSASRKPVESDVFIICVPTPINGDKQPNLRYVQDAATEIKPLVRPGCLIVLESTSPPETTTNLVATLAVPDNLKVGSDVFVAYCPERVIPGRVLYEVKQNDRVVGGVTQRCAEVAKGFYETFVEGTVVTTTAIVAELTKLLENSYRDVNIAFANELSMLAERFDADPIEIIQIANRHPRVNILQPGPGVGGHCISVDPWFLVHHSNDTVPLIKTARHVNESKPQFVVDKILSAVSEHNVKSVGCLGLAYKADVDDLRESPSVEIVRRLIKNGGTKVVVCEPFIHADCYQEIPLADLEDALECDMLVLLTDHSQFRALGANELAGKQLVDTRGVWRTQPGKLSQREAA